MFLLYKHFKIGLVIDIEWFNRTMMLSQLFNLFNAIVPLSEELKDGISSRLKYKKFKKHEYLLREGQICNYIYFIETGLIRSYYLKDGKEICSWFMVENEVIISVRSFYNRLPSEEFVQCLEDTSVYYISYDELFYLYKNYVEFNIIGRVLTEKYYMLSEERLFSMRRQTAKESYLYLLQNHPVLVQRVPRKYLASYLGITVETLSRMRFK